jgi:glucose-1-phosphate thymidylyltransferase
MKIVIPVAGVGSRLKPHTNSIPKPLMEVAGKVMLDYVIDDALKLSPDEIIFVVGYKKQSIIDHVEKTYPNVPKTFIEQVTRDGDGSAIRLALQKYTHDDELLIIFGDTLIDFDLRKSIPKKNPSDAIVFGMKVEEPQHYGVMNLGKEDVIIEIEEKPEKPKSNIAIIGTYYFKSLLKVKKDLDSFFENKQTIKGEYKIAQVLQKYVKNKKIKVTCSLVKKWFDCGRTEILLESNKYFLSKKSSNKIVQFNDSIIIPPVYISKTANIKNSVIGPNVSIGDGVNISNSIIKNSIVNHDSIIESLLLKDSLIGKKVILKGKSTKINIGEKSEVIFN